MSSMLHGTEVIGLFGGKNKLLRKKAEGDGGQEDPPFGKLTLCPKVTTICSKTAEKFPQRRKRNLRSGVSSHPI